MPTYISLVSWTEQGMRELKESPARADATAELAKSVGGKLVQLYWTVGPYDIVAIFEAPDDETAAAMQLTVGSRGVVRSRDRSLCLIATATVLELPRIGSSHAPTSCLCTGRNEPGQVALPLVVSMKEDGLSMGSVGRG